MPAAGTQGEGASEETAALQNVLFQAFRAGQVQLHRAPLPLTTVLSEHPRASPLARLQVRQQALVTNLRHDVVMLEDETARRFLTLVDGTRTAEELRMDLATRVDAEITHEDVMRSLRVLARLGLLLA
jgi:hypothetical protein